MKIAEVRSYFFTIVSYFIKEWSILRKVITCIFNNFNSILINTSHLRQTTTLFTPKNIIRSTTSCLNQPTACSIIVCSPKSNEVFLQCKQTSTNHKFSTTHSLHQAPCNLLRISKVLCLTSTRAYASI